MLQPAMTPHPLPSAALPVSAGTGCSAQASRCPARLAARSRQHRVPPEGPSAEKCELGVLGGICCWDGCRLLHPSRRPARSDALPAGVSACQEEAAVAGQSLLLNK